MELGAFIVLDGINMNIALVIFHVGGIFLKSSTWRSALSLMSALEELDVADVDLLNIPYTRPQHSALKFVDGSSFHLFREYSLALTQVFPNSMLSKWSYKM